MNELELYKEKVFDDIRHIDEYENEYWYARELQKYWNTKNGEILKL